MAYVVALGQGRISASLTLSLNHLLTDAKIVATCRPDEFMVMCKVMQALAEECRGERRPEG